MPATEVGQLDIKVGDTLIVEPCANFSPRGRKPEPVEVTVTKAARVWVEMTKTGEEPNFGNTWRMRRDTQDSGDRKYSQHNSHFYSVEQFEERQLVAGCRQILKDAKVDFDWRSPLYGNNEFLVALASFVKKWRSDHEV